jgi:hypothetical protein
VEAVRFMTPAVPLPLLRRHVDDLSAATLGGELLAGVPGGVVGADLHQVPRG